MKKDCPFDSLPPDEIRAIEQWESLPDPNAEERDRLAAEVERLRAERDAYYRTATERHLEIARIRAVADGLAQACRAAASTFEASDNAVCGGETIDLIESALAAYDAAAWPARAAEGEGGRDAS